MRAQIDRLTPWTADEAVFGWSPPAELGNDRIVVTVAATARAKVAPCVDALSELGAAFDRGLHRAAARRGAVPIKILEQARRGVVNVTRVRRGLVALLLLGGAAGRRGRQRRLHRRRQPRSPPGRPRAQASPSAAPRCAPAANERRSALGAERALERRKHATPSAVIVIEALSQILPDHTYVTELRIEADKLQVIGVTQDAPSLIRLIEQSSHFTRATFFAPTTRSPTDPGERFHIEAHIEPVFAPRS